MSNPLSICMKKASTEPVVIDLNTRSNRSGRTFFKKPSPKALKIGGVVVAALLVLGAIGATLAAHYGVFGQSAQHFLNNKILSPMHFGMTAEIPAWTIPTAAGGALALTGLFYGAHKLNQRCQTQTQSEPRSTPLDEQD